MDLGAVVQRPERCAIPSSSGLSRAEAELAEARCPAASASGPAAKAYKQHSALACEHSDLVGAQDSRDRLDRVGHMWHVLVQ